MPSLGEELTERLRDSRFGREFFGPRIAQPAARWLERNFGAEPIDRAEFGGAGSGESIVAIVDLHATELVEVAFPSPVPASASGSVLPADPLPPDLVPVDAEVDARESEGRKLMEVVKELGERVKEHNLVVVAAGIAFWGLLAIPATLFAIVSVAGLVIDPTTVKQEVAANLSDLPRAVQDIIGDQLEKVSTGSTGGLIAGVVVGLFLAFWTASGAMAKLMAALNTIYETMETRNFAKLRGTALLLTIGGVVFVSSAVFLLAVMPPLLRSIDAVGDSVVTLFNWLRFPLLGLVMVFGLSILYYLGPDRKTRYRPITLGAVVATLLWIALSALFTLYTSTFASYSETYGSIGGIVVLLLWLFITAFVVLLGAEIHALRESTARRL